MAPSSPKGRHTPFQRTFLYLYIDPLTRIRGSFKDMAMGACLARGNSRIFVLFSPPRANFRYLKDDGETSDFFLHVSKFAPYKVFFCMTDSLV